MFKPLVRHFLRALGYSGEDPQQISEGQEFSKDWVLLAGIGTAGADISGGLDTAKWVSEYTGRLHRVVLLDNDKVHIQSFIPQYSPLPEEYTLGTEPMWITDRISALMIMPLPPPPIKIEEIGLRISQDVFWIISPKGS